MEEIRKEDQLEMVAGRAVAMQRLRMDTEAWMNTISREMRHEL
jgi:hypothetical protein